MGPYTEEMFKTNIKKILHECLCIIEFIKQVEKKRLVKHFIEFSLLLCL